MAGSNGEPSDKLSPDNNADVLLGADCSNKTITELQPDPVHAFRLWQIFIDRVNPLLKIVHIPTLQPYVLEGAVSMSNIPLNYQALLFAVYLIATLSLTEDESLQILGHPRESMMQRYMQGVKLALVRFDFLRNYDMATLQALLLYLVSVTNEDVTAGSNTTRRRRSKGAMIVMLLGFSAVRWFELHRRWVIIMMANSSICLRSRRRCGAEFGGKWSRSTVNMRWSPASTILSSRRIGTPRSPPISTMPTSSLVSLSQFPRGKDQRRWLLSSSCCKWPNSC